MIPITRLCYPADKADNKGETLMMLPGNLRHVDVQRQICLPVDVLSVSRVCPIPPFEGIACTITVRVAGCAVDAVRCIC